MAGTSGRGRGRPPGRQAVQPRSPSPSTVSEVSTPPASIISQSTVVKLQPIDDEVLELKWHQLHVLPILAEDPRPIVRETLLSPNFIAARTAPIRLLKQVNAAPKSKDRMPSEQRMIAVRLLARLIRFDRQLRDYARDKQSRWPRTLCDMIIKMPIEHGDTVALDNWACAVRALTYISKEHDMDVLAPALSQLAGSRLPDYVVHRAAQLVESVHIRLPFVEADQRGPKRVALVEDLAAFLDALNISVGRCVALVSATYAHRSLALLTPLTLRTAACLLSFTKSDPHSSAHRDCILTTTRLLYDLRTDTALDEPKTFYELLEAEDLTRLVRTCASQMEMIRSAPSIKDELVRDHLWEINVKASWLLTELMTDDRMVSVILRDPTYLPVTLTRILEPSAAQLLRPGYNTAITSEPALLGALSMLAKILSQIEDEHIGRALVTLVRDARLLDALAGSTIQLAARQAKVTKPVLSILRSMAKILRQFLLVSIPTDTMDRESVTVVSRCAPSVVAASPKAVRFIILAPPSPKLEALLKAWLGLVDAAELSDDPRCMFCVGCSASGCQYRCSRCHDMYCSDSCRTGDWPTHKLVCAAKEQGRKANEVTSTDL